MDFFIKELPVKLEEKITGEATIVMQHCGEIIVLETGISFLLSKKNKNNFKKIK